MEQLCLDSLQWQAADSMFWVSQQVHFENLPSSLRLLHQHTLARLILLAMVVTAQQQSNMSSFILQFSSVVSLARSRSACGNF